MGLYTVDMIKVVVTDFSRVLLFPTDESYKQGLNALNNQLLDTNPNYDFKKYFKINEELLEYYASLELPVYIFTSETIQEHPAIKAELNNVFSRILSAKHLNVSKTDKNAYIIVARELKVQPSEILYIDDKFSNIQVADDAGCATILYKSNADVVGEIE